MKITEKSCTVSFNLFFIKISKLILISNLFLIACSNIEDKEPSLNETVITDNDFEERIVLEAKEIDPINRQLVYPKFIHLSDTVLIAVEQDLSDGFFKIFSLPEFNYLGSYGQRGEGPGEYSQVLSNMVQMRDSTGKSSIIVLDWAHKRVSKLNIEQLLSGELQKFEDSYLLPPDLMLSQRAAFVNDTTVVSAGGTDKGILTFVNTNTESLSHVPFSPLIDRNLSVREKRELHSAEFAIDKTKNRIVSATMWFPKILIFDLEGNLLNEIRFFDYDHPTDIPENDRTIFYQDIKVTDEYIYGLFLNISYTEMEDIYNNYASDDIKYSSEVHVFNWEGEPVRKLILNDKFIQSMEVDPLNHKIYAIDVFSDDLSLLLFESEVIQ